MTRTISAGRIQNKKQGTARDGKPKPGTEIRQLYDALRRGEIIFATRRLRDLRDFYGMEICAVVGYNQGVRLVGEWEGPYFVPVERMMQD